MTMIVTTDKAVSLVARRRRLSSYEGEIKLMLATLENGIRAYLKGPGCRSSEQRAGFTEAEQWLRENTSELFSFTNLCESLAIDPFALRQSLIGLRLQERRAALDRLKLQLDVRPADRSHLERSGSPRPADGRAHHRGSRRVARARADNRIGRLPDEKPFDVSSA